MHTASWRYLFRLMAIPCMALLYFHPMQLSIRQSYFNGYSFRDNFTLKFTRWNVNHTWTGSVFSLSFETIGMKYFFTVIVTFLLSMGIFHIFIRPYAIARFLFGMKSKQKLTYKQPVIQMVEQPVI